MTAVWLLRVVVAEVAAASGGILAPHLADAAAQFAVLTASYALLAYSVPVAFGILSILMLRMALHKLPHKNMAASSWLALGPIGTGAFGLLVLVGDAPAILAAHDNPPSAWLRKGSASFGGLMLWGFGLWWLLLAGIIPIRYVREGAPFNLGWWGYTFPLGVYTAATLKLGATLGLAFFTVAGAFLASALASAWVVVATLTFTAAGGPAVRLPLHRSKGVIGAN